MTILISFSFSISGKKNWTFFSSFSISIPFHSPHSQPYSPHSHPYSSHSHPYSPHSHSDLPHCLPDFSHSPAFNPYSLHSHHDSPHSHPDSLHSHPDSPHSDLIPRVLTVILRVPTLIPRVLIIPLIPFPDSPFRLLQAGKSCV